MRNYPTFLGPDQVNSIETSKSRSREKFRYLSMRQSKTQEVVQICECETGLIEMGEAVQFYRRKLPEMCTSFNSDEGKKIFKEALDEGGVTRLY